MKIIGNLNLRVQKIQILGKVVHFTARNNPTQTIVTNLHHGVPAHQPHLHIPQHLHHLHLTDFSIQYYPAHHQTAAVQAGQEVIITFDTPHKTIDVTISRLEILISLFFWEEKSKTLCNTNEN